RTREVEARGRAVVGEHLGLETGQQAQGLRVALEPADVARDLGQRRLAVVAERRVAEVVREARRVDDVGVATERAAHAAAHLRHLERVGQARAHEVVVPGAGHLGLGAEPTQRGGVHDAPAVTLERGPGLRLGRLDDPALDVRLAVRRRDAAPEGLLHAATLARLLVVAVPAQAAGQVDGVLLRPRVPGPGTDLEAHGRQPLLRDVELDGAERQ